MKGVASRHAWVAQCPARRHTAHSVATALDGHGAGWGLTRLWLLWGAREWGWKEEEGRGGGISKGECLGLRAAERQDIGV